MIGHKLASMLVNPIPASILRHLSERELSLSDLSRTLGLSKSRISYHLVQLEKAGLIERTREEVYRGGVRKFYRTSSTLQLPRLSDLSGAEKEALLLPIKTFLWGYLLGKFEDGRWDFERLVGSGIDEFAKEIAENIEQMIIKGEEIGEGEADTLYLKLLIRLVQQHLKKEKNKVEQLGLSSLTEK